MQTQCHVRLLGHTPTSAAAEPLSYLRVLFGALPLRRVGGGVQGTSHPAAHRHFGLPAVVAGRSGTQRIEAS
jgi:hypothetical protein